MEVAQKADPHVTTIAAWLSLARCRRAIVAPIPSTFSNSAARAAGVPVVGCCTELHKLQNTTASSSATHTAA